MPIILALALLQACTQDIVVPWSYVRVGGLENNQAFAPVLLDESTVAIRSAGGDGLFRTRDDELVIVYLPGGRVQRVPIPFLSASEESQPVPVSPTTLVLGVAAAQPQISAVGVGLAINNFRYSLTIDNRVVYYTSGGAASNDEILMGLASAIGATPLNVTTSVQQERLIIRSASATETFALSVGTNLETLQVEFVSVGSILDNSAYRVSINDVDFEIASGAPADAAAISLALTDAINLGIQPLIALDEMGAIVLIGDDPANPFVATVPSNGRLNLITGSAAFGGYDDALAVVTGIGGTQAPSVSIVTVGPMRGEASHPAVIDSGSVALTIGSDATCPGSTANPALGDVDDAFVVVTGLGGTPALSSSVCLGYLSSSALSRPAMIGGASGVAVLGSSNVDGNFGDSTDLIYVIPNLGATPGPATSLMAGPLSESVASQAIFVNDLGGGDLRALISTGGNDGQFGNNNDQLSLLYNLGTGSPDFCFIPSPGHLAGLKGRAAVIGDNAAVVAGVGLDLMLGTSDDIINHIGFLDANPPETGMDLANECDGGVLSQTRQVRYLPTSDSAQPVPLSPTIAVVPTAGADTVFANNAAADDEFVILSDLDTDMPLTDGRLIIGPLSPLDARVRIFPGATTSLKVLLRGMGTEVISITDPLGTPSVNRVEIDPISRAGASTIPVGTNLAVTTHPGIDGVWGTADDSLLIIPI